MIFPCRMSKIMPQVRISKAVICCNVVRMPLLKESRLAVFSRLAATKHFQAMILKIVSDEKNPSKIQGFSILKVHSIFVSHYNILIM